MQRRSLPLRCLERLNFLSFLAAAAGATFPTVDRRPRQEEPQQTAGRSSGRNAESATRVSLNMAIDTS